MVDPPSSFSSFFLSAILALTSMFIISIAAGTLAWFSHFDETLNSYISLNMWNNLSGEVIDSYGYSADGVDGMCKSCLSPTLYSVFILFMTAVRALIILSIVVAGIGALLGIFLTWGGRRLGVVSVGLYSILFLDLELPLTYTPSTAQIAYFPFGFSVFAGIFGLAAYGILRGSVLYDSARIVNGVSVPDDVEVGAISFGFIGALYIVLSVVSFIAARKYQTVFRENFRSALADSAASSASGRTPIAPAENV